jgi:hypothetical protein
MFAFPGNNQLERCCMDEYCVPSPVPVLTVQNPLYNAEPVPVRYDIREHPEFVWSSAIFDTVRGTFTGANGPADSLQSTVDRNNRQYRDWVEWSRQWTLRRAGVLVVCFGHWR